MHDGQFSKVGNAGIGNTNLVLLFITTLTSNVSFRGRGIKKTFDMN